MQQMSRLIELDLMETRHHPPAAAAGGVLRPAPSGRPDRIGAAGRLEDAGGGVVVRRVRGLRRPGRGLHGGRAVAQPAPGAGLAAGARARRRAHALARSARCAAARARRRRQGYRLTDLLLQLVQGIRVVKVYSGEELETRNSIATARRYFEQLVSATRIKALGDVGLETAGSLSVVTVVVAGGFEIMAGRLSMPSLVAVLVAIRAIHGPLNNAFGRLHRQPGQLELARAHPRAAGHQARRPRPSRRGARSTSRSRRCGSSRCRSATTRRRPVLTDVSFDVRMGQHVGIVGPSGAGKTTLVSLLARFYDPTGGRILLNGRDLRDYRLRDLHRHLALVTQDLFVFGTSVRENIRYGSHHGVRRRGRARRGGGRNPRRHREAAGRLRHGARRRRPPAVGRPGPAHQRRAGAAQGRADRHPRRGHLEPRLDLGGEDPGGARAADARQDHVHHRAPALDAARGRSHPRRGSRHGGGVRLARGAAAQQRPLPRAVGHAAGGRAAAVESAP